MTKSTDPKIEDAQQSVSREIMDADFKVTEVRAGTIEQKFGKFLTRDEIEEMWSVLDEPLP